MKQACTQCVAYDGRRRGERMHEGAVELAECVPVAKRIRASGSRAGGPGERRSRWIGVGRENRRKKNTPANKSQTLPSPPRAASGNFSMAPAELEFSLIFTFSRRPPRGSAIVRTASLGAPTTITEKMQRSEDRGKSIPTLPTYLPT